MKFGFSDPWKKLITLRMSTWETFDRATIYVAFNLDLRARRRKSTGKCSLAFDGKDNCFPRRCTGDVYMSDAKGGRASSRKKQPDTIFVVVENEDETRGSSPAVTCTHACRQADTRGCERKGVVDDEGGRRERLAWRLVPLSMHADGLALYWNASLSFFPRDDGIGGRKKRWVA